MAELLLLNILRAMARQPRYFTALTQIRGSLTSEVRVGFNIPFVHGGDNPFWVAPEGLLSSSPSFDVAILDSEKFMRGIMRPIGGELFKYYWEQGWPRDLLLYLLVDKIRFVDSNNNLVGEFVNSPHHSKNEELDKFKAVTETIFCAKPIASLETYKPFGPKFKKLDPSAMLDAKREGLEIGFENGCYQFMQPRTTIKLECSHSDKDCFGSLRQLLGTSSEDAKIQFVFEEAATSEKNRGAAAREAIEGCSLAKEAEARTATVEGIVLLRSPEAVLYYLGEIARAEQRNADWSPPQLHDSTDCGPPSHPLFVVKPGKAQDAEVSVDFNGQNYYIPADAAGDRSMHCLWILTELFGLHKSFDELPTTQAVVLSGGR
ncbi:MAG: hypothetical protein HY268_09275 [Deltaproteobacteria bacterium]|nr:hypothetical protein [Deltaproteobacteria bacterium]